MRRVSTVRSRSVKQEDVLAQKLNAYPVAGSGSNPFRKGDIRNATFLAEVKYTDKPFYILRISTWDKIRKEATADGLRIPIMLVDLNYETPEQTTLAIVDANLLDAHIIKAYPARFSFATTNSSVRVSADKVPSYVTFEGKSKTRLFIGELRRMIDFIDRV